MGFSALIIKKLIKMSLVTPFHFLCQYMNVWLNKSILSPGAGVRQLPLWRPLRTNYSLEGQAFLYFTRSVCVCLCVSTYIRMSVCMGLVAWHSFNVWEAAFGCLLCPSVICPCCFLILMYLIQNYPTDFVFLIRILILGIIRFRYFFFLYNRSTA